MLTNERERLQFTAAGAVICAAILVFALMAAPCFCLAAETDESVDIIQENVDKSEADEDESSSENGDVDSEKENFPESFLPFIDDLKQKHPDWEFRACDTDLSWKKVLDIEDRGTTNLVEPSAPSSMREHSDRTYDGRWYPAARKAIAYYMDPRNFLNEKDIFQFVLHTYDGDSQNADTVSSIIEGSFMEEADPMGEYESFSDCISDAGEHAGVNPNVIAAMIVLEQGWKGSSLCTGKKKGFKNLYNFLNVGAWTTSDMTSVERGLWYAKGEGKGKTTYERPWNTPFRAITGGAQIYAENYISNNQDTFYTKKFNVKNGEGEVGTHQYMTNVAGALDEGKLLKRAYLSNMDLPVIFEIPIYEDMPEKPCAKP